MTLTSGQEQRLVALRLKRGGELPESWKKALDVAMAARARGEKGPFSDIIFRLLNSSPEDDHAGEVLGRRGWTTPGWATHDQLREFSRRSTVWLDGFFLRTYTRKPELIERMVKSSSSRPCMLKWSRLYRQAVHQFMRRQYLVAVPALLLIFEGLLVGPQPKRGRTRPVLIIKQLAQQQRGSWRCSWLSLATFAETVYANQQDGAPQPGVMNRHLILHGKAAPRWGRTDCLRLIQAIDTASRLLGAIRSSRS